MFNRRNHSSIASTPLFSTLTLEGVIFIDISSAIMTKSSCQTIKIQPFAGKRQKESRLRSCQMLLLSSEMI